MKTLTIRHQQFVREYLVDLNATAAYRRVYPRIKEHVARTVAAQLLAKPHIQAAVAAGMARRALRTEVTADRVVAELAKIGLFDARRLYAPDGTLLQPADWPDDVAAVVASVEVVEDTAGGKAVTRTRKVKLWDKKEALGLLARHLGILNDKLKVETPPPPSTPLATLTDEQLRRLREQLDAPAGG